MSDPVEEWRAGRISAPVALARLACSGLNEAQIERRLPAGSALAACLGAHRKGLARLRAMLSQSGDVGTTQIEAMRTLFDRAVSISAEGSVAAYSLGEASLLARATDELIEWLVASGLIGHGMDVLDVGCGIGRVVAALAPHVRSVTGTDISTGMIERARERCADLANVEVEVVDGSGRLAFADRSSDLVLFVDSMPYLVQAAVADAHVGDAARVLRPGGALAIFNLSYRDPRADETDARRWAGRHGWEWSRSSPFRLWDGTAFVFRSSKNLTPRARSDQVDAT